MSRVMIAVPNLGNIDTRLMMKLIRWTAQPDGWQELSIIAPIGQIPHDSARNYCVDMLQQTDCTHLFFLDADVIPPADGLKMLLEADKDVISGLYPSTWYDNRKRAFYKRQNVFSSVGEDGEMVEAKGEGVQPIHSAGTGCLLMKRHVLEQDVDAPHFKFEYNDVGIMTVGEDVYFSRKYREAGGQMFAHFGVQCQHVKETVL